MLAMMRSRRFVALAAVSAASLLLAACGSNGGSGGGGDDVAVTLITKNASNPFFVTMQKGAKTAGEKEGVSVTTAAGKEDGDEQGQIAAIEDAIANGDDGILITPTGPGVNPAIEKAHESSWCRWCCEPVWRRALVGGSISNSSCLLVSSRWPISLGSRSERIATRHLWFRLSGKPPSVCESSSQRPL